MHVAEHYALSCGAQLSTPHIPSDFYPIPYKKYICLVTQSDILSKKYDFYQEVVDLLLPFLGDVKIVQLGAHDDPHLRNTINYGALSRKQNNYIVANSLAVIGNDFYYTHAAGALNKNLITLFGPLYKDISRPFWGEPSHQSLIESHRNNHKPSFSGDEGENKSINLIYPEEIARQTLALLKIENTLQTLETVNMGSFYKIPVVELIPDELPAAGLYEGTAINFRLDLNFEPDMISKWAFNRKLNVIIDRPLERKYLDIVKPHITQVMIEVNEKTSADDIRSITEGGYKTHLFSTDAEAIQNLRLQFLDHNIYLNKLSKKKDLDNSDKICDNTYFKSSKIMTSKNKHYASKASWLAGVEKQEEEKVIDSPEFWEELEYFRIYNK